MKKPCILLTFLGLIHLLNAQNNPIHILRTNDNFQYLKNDSIPKKGFEKLKMLPLGNSKNRLSIGGEIREQVQHFENINFGDVPPVFAASSATQLWHRVLLHGDVELGKKVRFFSQINHTLRLFNPNPLIEIDENQLGLHQVFMELRPSKSVNIRIGRQEMGYGNNRMLTFREGPNNRLAYDAAVVKWQNSRLRVDALVAFPVFQSPKINDDIAFEDRVLGVYATQTLLDKRIFLDLYWLSFTGKRLKYNLVGGDEQRESFGTRLFSKNPKLNYELEATYQSGKFNQLNINALGIAFDVNLRLAAKTKLTLGLAGNYITGDQKPTDNQLNTFNLLFSKPSFGLAAPIGASNIVNVNPYLRWQPLKKLQLLASIYILSKQSINDGVYSPGMSQTRPVRPNQLFTSQKKQIGNQYALEAGYQANRQWAFYVDFAHFPAGTYVKETGNGKAISYFSSKIAYKF
jgi:Alginate export